MHASAVFGAPPPGEAPGGGAPPRAPHGQHPQQSQPYGHPNGAPQQPQLQEPQYGGGYGQPPPVQRSRSRDSEGGTEFETLDLHSNHAGANASGAGSAGSAPGNAGAGAAGFYNAPHASSPGEDFSNYHASSQGEDFSGYHASSRGGNFGGYNASSATASGGPGNFGGHAASSRGEDFSGYNASSQGENFSSYNANSQGENFSHPPPEGRGGDETFEYEGVALQTALNAFGGVATFAGSMAGNVAGGVMSSAGGVMSSVAPGRLAGNMASFRGRIADVVAPVGPGGTGPMATAPHAPSGGGPAPRPPSPYMRGTSGGSAGSAAEVFAAPSPQASPVVTSVTPPQGGPMPPPQPLPPAAGSSWEVVHDSGGGATEFFGAGAAAGPPVQGRPGTDGPAPPQGPPTAERAFSQPPQVPRRQLSHRMSSLEKATRDPHSFQYADPAEVVAVQAPAPATAMETMQRGSEPVAPPSAQPEPPTPAMPSSSLPAPRRRPPLPAPKKPNLPLPPPLSARKKIPNPSEGSSASSASGAGQGKGPPLGGARFRKPPPLEVRASPAGTPRCLAPSAPAGAGRGGASPAGTPRFRAPPSPRAAGPASGAARTSPWPSPRTAEASPGTATVPPLPLPLPSPGAASASSPRAAAASPRPSSEAATSPEERTVPPPAMAAAVVRAAVDDAVRRASSEIGAPAAAPPSAAAPAVLPDAASSRVAECDATSDYQGLVREEDVPPFHLSPGEEDVPPAAPATPVMDSGAALPRDAAGSYAVVAADGRSNRPEPPKDDDAPPAAELDSAAPVAPVEGGAVFDAPAAEWPAGDVAEDTPVLSQEREEGGGVATEEPTHEDPAPAEAPHDGPPVDALPDGWTAAADPASGGVYYYHRATGEARWDRPTVEMAPVAGAEEEPAAEAEGEAAEGAPATEGATEPAPEVSTEPAAEAPADEEPAEEEARATAPAAETESTDASRDPAAADEAPPAGSSTATEPAVRPLAEGWTESTDPSTGNPYYYHVGTGETTWDRPDAAAETEGTDRLRAGEATVAAAAPEPADPSAERDDERAAAEPAPEPPSTVDEGGLPAADAVEETHDAHCEGDAPAAAPSVPAEPAVPPEGAAGNPVASNALPEGWSEAVDPASGEVYYYHGITGETRWDRPAVATATDGGAPPAEGAPLAEDAAEGTAATSVAEAASRPSAPPVVESGPAADGDEPKERPAAVEAPPSEGTDRPPTPGVPGESTLAEGWVEATDESSGNAYYYHSASGETRWDRPAAAPAAPEKTALETAPPPAGDDGPGEAPAAGDAPAEPLEPLDEGWTAVERPAPAGAGPARGEGAAPPEGKPEDLPEGWAEAADPTTGKAYYYRAGSGECAWERPVAMAEESVGEAPRGDRDEGAAGEEAMAGSESAESARAAGGTEPPGVPRAPSLPEGWSEATDPSSGTVYYYEEATGETTWDRPQPAAAGAPNAAPARASQPTTTAATQPRPRPAHALATFGFGGRLCVMMPRAAAPLSGTLSGAASRRPGERPTLRRGPVVIHRLRSVISGDDEYSIPSPDAAGVAPLICARDDDVHSFLAERGGDDLLWTVVDIAAQNGGRLRNDRAAREAVVEALLASRTAPGSERTTTSGGGGGGGVSGAAPPAADLAAVQRPLLRGDRSAAVAAALARKNYALALLIASMCDRATYQNAARRYADEALPAGSPLRLAALRFSNNVDAPSDEALLDPASGDSVWCGEEYGGLAATWREQLVSILSNPTPGWERIVLTLGDRLLQLGRCQAAHVCYLVSFCHFGPPAAKATRLVLLGCDHTAALHRRLMTPASVRAFERTEAFEWARRRGNRKTHIPALQPFKLRYAELLADFGRERLARDYLLSVRSCLGLDGADPGAPPAVAPDFVEALKRLDDRICGSIGAAPSSWDGGKGDAKGAAAALGSIVKSVWGKKPKADEARPSGGAELATREEVPRATGGAAEGPAAEPARNAARPVDLYTMHHTAQDEEPTPEGDEMNESFTTTKTSLEPPVAAEGAPQSPRLLSNPFGHDLGHAASPKEKTNEEPPSSAPPMFGLDLEPKRPAEEEPKGKIVPSTPSQPAKPEEKKKAPASEPVQTPRSGGWFSKLLGRDSESKAKVADVGEDMQAYYDEKLKRWIFPGDDPAEVAKPLAPPPIMPATAAEDAPATPAVAAAAPSNDPLAAMMAPPPSRALNSRKKGTPLAGRYADPLASMGGVSAASNKKMMLPPSPMNRAPPTFAVFQPKPASSKPVSSEEEK